MVLREAQNCPLTFTGINQRFPKAVIKLLKFKPCVVLIINHISPV